MIIGLLIMTFMALGLIGLIALWQWQREMTLIKAQKRLLEQALSEVEIIDDSLDTGAVRRVLDIDQSQDASVQPQAKPLLMLSLIFLVCVLGLGLHMISPMRFFQDFPYEEQKKLWAKTLATDPGALAPEAVAAVMRSEKVKRANDPKFWLYLAQIETLADQPYAATKAFETARALQGDQFIAYAEWGEALTLVAKVKPTKGALDAFNEALKLNPNEPRTHYYLGRFAYDRGQFDVAEDHYRRTLNALTPDDPRRQWVENTLKEVSEAKQKGDESRNMIEGMVASLQQKLNDNPDNPEGWARLLRSLDILGNETELAKANSRLDEIYKDRPIIKEQIIVTSKAAVGSEMVSIAPISPNNETQTARLGQK
jgi:cytochrome c-type biogenesis protein CcmH